jgi:hypothetical protein
MVVQRVQLPLLAILPHMRDVPKLAFASHVSPFMLEGYYRPSGSPGEPAEGDFELFCRAPGEQKGDPSPR